MKYFHFFLIVIIITSCGSTFFEDIQPNGGQELNEFPKALQGKWGESHEGGQITSSACAVMVETEQLIFSLKK